MAAPEEEITCEELIARIADGLAQSASGEWIVEIANKVLVGEFIYIEDERVVVIQEDMDHG